MANFRSGIVLINSQIHVPKFSSLRSASYKYPASKIFEFRVSDNMEFKFKASYSVLFIQVSTILIFYIFKAF